MTAKKHNLLLRRASQYFGIILIVAVFGGGYWYWKNAHAGANLQSSQEGTLTNGLVGYWPFDGNDISGTTAYDRSGQGNNGTLTNGPTKTIGRVGQGLSFDGTDDYINMGNTNNISTGNFTISYWFKTSLSVYKPIVAKRLATPSYNQYQTGVGYVNSLGNPVDSGSVFFFASDGVNKQGVHTTATNYADGAWHHVDVTRTSSGVLMYVDGVLVSLVIDSAGISSQNYSNSGNFNIGYSNSSYFFSGSLDEVRIYNRALSASEIWDLYQAGAADKVNSADSQIDPLEKGMVGYWKLDDGSGTSAADASGNGNTGTLVNSPSWVAGQINGALSFNGTNQRAYVTSSSSLNFGSGSPFSVSAWIKTTQTVPGGKNLRFINKFTNSPSYKGYIMEIDENQKVVFYTKDGTTVNQVSSTSTINDGAWHHLVAVREISSGLLRIYVDGVQQNAASITNGDLSVSSNLNLGFELLLADNVYLNGSLDEIRIYNRALSVEEVSKLYKTTAPDNPDTGLVGYWPFNGTDISGTTAYDRSGKGNNGTLTNSPALAIGKVGQGLSFNGTSTYVSMPYAGTDFERTDPFSFSVWAKWNDVGIQSFIGKTTGADKGIALGECKNAATNFCNANSIYLWLLGGGASYLTMSTATNSIISNIWTHVVATYDGSSAPGGIRIYVNGANMTLTTQRNSLTTSIKPGVNWRIGDDYTNDWANGSIDEVRIYNRVLTQAEVSALYNAGR